MINVLLPSTHEIICSGDKHLGTILSYNDGIEQTYDYIMQKKNRFQIDMGDRIEGITVSDKRFMGDSANKKGALVPFPLKQIESAKQQDVRVAKRTLAMLLGNHELTLRGVGNLTEWLCNQLSKEVGKEIIYGTYTCVVNVHDEHGLMYRIFLSHGFGATKNTLKKKLQNKASDCLIMGMGHTHKLFAIEPTKQLCLAYGEGKPKQHYLTWDGKNDYIEPDNRWYFNSGSYLRMYGKDDEVSYTEVKGYDPVELGFMTIKCYDRQVTDLEKIVV